MIYTTEFGPTVKGTSVIYYPHGIPEPEDERIEPVGFYNRFEGHDFVVTIRDDDIRITSQLGTAEFPPGPVKVTYCGTVAEWREERGYA